MNIGILGTGDVGKQVAAGFAKKGHTVKVGTRDPGSEKVAKLVKYAGKNCTSGTFDEAAAFGELLFLATLWSGTQNALTLAGRKNFAGKILIDATNPLVFEPGKMVRLALGHTDSGGEQVQRWVPDARVVKAFNIVGNADMVDPNFPGGPPDMFICGNDAQAKSVVTRLLKEFGCPAFDLGGIECSRVLEPICILWVIYGMKSNSWNHAVRMLRR